MTILVGRDRVCRERECQPTSLRSSGFPPLPVQEIDLAFARARYAQWMGATRPAFAEPAGSGRASTGTGLGPAAGATLWLPALRHPLLLAASLEPPALRHWEEETPLLVAETRRGTYLAPPPPPSEQQQNGRGGALPSFFPPRASAAGAATASSQPAKPVSQARVGADPFCSPPPPSSMGDDDGDEDSGGASDAGTGELGPPPKPIDVTVPAGARVVVISGPNAGGKTASMKALALATLMARSF